MNFIKKILKTKFWLPIIIVLLVLLNWLASEWHTRIDFTNEKRFTLSKPTKKLLKNLDDEVQIDVCLKGEFPSGFKKLANSTDEILQEFKEVAGNNKLSFNFVSPDEQIEGTSETYADTLAALGVDPINLKVQLKSGEQQQFVYPTALVHYKGNIMPVNLYAGDKIFITPEELNSAEAMMEYGFANAIDKLSRTEKPMIAYSSGNGEPTDITTYDLENTLRKDYNLFTLNLNTQPAIPDTFKLLIVVKPKQAFSAQEKLKIDQFVMRGGKVIMFVDKLEAEMDSLQIKNEVIAYDRGLNLDDILFKYGIRINSDLVMDLQCDLLPFDVNGNGQFEWLPWNYFPLFQTKNNHPINKNLGFVAGRFVNSIDTVEADGITKTVLLSSSANSRTIATPALISGKENVNAPEDDKFKRANIPVAVLLEGKFESVYNNHLSQAMRDSLAAYNATFIPQCVDENKIIIVSDGDIVLNGIKDNKPIPMGMNQFAYGTQKEFPFANKDFLQNCMDYLINESGLSEAKAKDYTLRLLDPKKIEDEKLEWQIGNILGPILLVLLFGSIYQWWRKRKYTTNG
jgi:ABC-2 type transport system permease protein